MKLCRFTVDGRTRLGKIVGGTMVDLTRVAPGCGDPGWRYLRSGGIRALVAFGLAIASLSNAGVAAASLVAARLAAPLPPPRTSCDRQCLVSIADRYFAAALARDTTRLPLDPAVRLTENTEALPVGQGLLWRGLSAPLGKFRIDVVDPESGQIAIGTVAKIGGQPYLTAVRLKVRANRIVEIEQLLANNIQPLAMPNLVEPRRPLLEDVPPSERNTRADMVRIANSYFDALTSEDSSRAYFAPDCVRHEMGLRTTGNKAPLNLMLPANVPVEAQQRMRILMNGITVRNCREQIDSGAFADLQKIEPRRPIVVDVEKGLVAAFPMFIQNGDVRPSKLVGYPGLDRLPAPLPFTTQWLEIFKIHGGMIHEIEAPVMLPLYYGAGNGWDLGSGQ